MQTDTIAVSNPHGLIVPDIRYKRPSEGRVGEWRYDPDIVEVKRELRDDPLGLMHARKQIGQAQYAAGRRYQATVEAMGIGKMRSSGDLREHVDGGQIASDGITDRQLTAAKLLAVWRGKLGEDGARLVEAVLIDKRTIREVADASPMMTNKAATTFYGHLFRRQLTILAKCMGMTT